MNSRLLGIRDFSPVLAVLASVSTTYPLSPAPPGHKKLILYVFQRVIMGIGHKITATLNM